MPTERRKIGRPRKTWGEGIKEAMIEKYFINTYCQICLQLRKSVEVGLESFQNCYSNS